MMTIWYSEKFDKKIDETVVSVTLAMASTHLVEMSGMENLDKLYNFVGISLVKNLCHIVIHECEPL